MRQRGLTALVVACALALPLISCSPQGQTSRSTATVATTPSPTIQTAQAGGQGCTVASGSTRIGDLIISKPMALFAFNSDFALPDGLPSRPLQVTIQNNSAYVDGAPLQSRPLAQSVAFVIGVCNASATTSHRLTGFGMKLATLATYTGSLNVLNACAFLYGGNTGFGGECASGYSPDVELSFTFPAQAAQGSTAQASASPVDLAPGVSKDLSFSAPPPSGAVTLTYQLGLGVDGAVITYPSSLSTQQEIITPVARRWSGEYCKAPAMLTQVPTPIPAGTYYVCPKA
ncbi:MAG TPA: hypothetical protein VF812_11450 [Ktedonobacterales bacterium]